MPLYVMIAHDGPEGVSRRNQFRHAHVTHVQALHDAGRIALAGPIKDDNHATSVGAVIIFQAASLSEARQCVEQDPYVSGGVFAKVDVHPFQQVIPRPL